MYITSIVSPRIAKSPSGGSVRLPFEVKIPRSSFRGRKRIQLKSGSTGIVETRLTPARSQEFRDEVRGSATVVTARDGERINMKTELIGNLEKIMGTNNIAWPNLPSHRAPPARRSWLKAWRVWKIVLVSPVGTRVEHLRVARDEKQARETDDRAKEGGGREKKKQKKREKKGKKYVSNLSNKFNEPGGHRERLLVRELRAREFRVSSLSELSASRESHSRLRGNLTSFHFACKLHWAAAF